MKQNHVRIRFGGRGSGPPHWNLQSNYIYIANLWEIFYFARWKVLEEYVFKGEFTDTVLITPPPHTHPVPPSPEKNPRSEPDKVRLSFTLSVGARLSPAVHPGRPSPLSYRWGCCQWRPPWYDPIRCPCSTLICSRCPQPSRQWRTLDIKENR